MTSKRSVLLFSTTCPEEFITGPSNAIRRLYETIQKLSRNDATVLIQGETGSGKEIAAQALHRSSVRRNKPFIAVNCGSIPSELFESELFGHERGAFTSALDTKPGKFELANGGTLFLDEIGTLPKHLQVKLLRVLQERCIERIGGTDTIPVNVRIIAATNAELKKEVHKGSFREDLYHRLNVVPLQVPALRDRREDIPLLLTNFFMEYGTRYDNRFSGIELKAVEKLKNYDWPGNVRELRHLVERIVALEEGPICKLTHLPAELCTPGKGTYKGSSFNEIIRNIERDMLHSALSEHEGNFARAARYLGLKRTTLISKVKQYDLLPAY